MASLSPSNAARETILASLLSALLAALAVGSCLWDTGRVHSALDAASVQLPWAANLPPDAPAGAQNPELADQATQRYPLYRWVSRSWRSGDVPLWNPLIYAGVPGLANAQAGVVDPQVLFLVALESVGGLTWFHWGLGVLAWFHYAAALLGAYLLARRLGLQPIPSGVCAVTFGFSGYLTLWLNHPLGHVPPFLPWMLWLLDRIRDSRRPPLPVAGAAVALGCAILGGHAETAFYVGLAGGLWALLLLLEDRRRGAFALGALALGTLLAAIGLIPLSEYLNLSAAREVRALEAQATVVDVGALCAVGLVLLAAALFVRLGPGAVSRPTGPRWLLLGGGLVAAVLAASLFLRQRGLGGHADLALVPDRLGTPGDGEGGYRGEFNYIEVASAWVSLMALGLALAAALSPTPSGSPGLRGRRLWLALGAIAFLLSIELPGLLDLYRFVPLVGLGATVRLASVGSLALGLLAGEGLQRAPSASRIAAATILAPLVALSLGAWSAPSPAFDQARPPLPEKLSFCLVPEERLEGQDSNFEGWFDRSLGYTAARVRVEPVGRDEEGFRIPLDFHDQPSKRARSLASRRVQEAPQGAVWFRTPYFLTSLLPNGDWRFTVDFYRGPIDGVAAAEAVIGTSRVARRIERRTPTLLLLGASLLVLAFSRRGSGPLAWASLALALGHGLWFSRGINPSPRAEEVFPPTRTEAILAEELGPHRFFADPQVLPPNTGLVRGLAALDGYDAMDVAAYNAYRFNLLPAGTNPILSWNPRSIDLSHPVFALLGVGMLAMREPFEHPGWKLVAGPEHERSAEAWISERWKKATNSVRTSFSPSSIAACRASSQGIPRMKAKGAKR